MTDLLLCVECSAPVHRQAHYCQKCRTNKPHGVTCRRCGELLKASAAQEYTIPGTFYDIVHYHKDCYSAVMARSRPCRGCALELAGTSAITDYSPKNPWCPEWGAPNT